MSNIIQTYGKKRPLISYEHISPHLHLLLPAPNPAMCFCVCLRLQPLYKGATRVILATENDYCKLCDASFSSLAVAQAHYHGKNHAKKLRLAEAQQNSSNTWVLSRDTVQTGFH